MTSEKVSKKNVYILTFHCAHNYGAVLQTYATLNFLRSYNYKAQVIDYRPKFLTKPFKRFRAKYYLARNPKLLIHRLFNEPRNLPQRFRLYKKFNSFIQTKLDPIPFKHIQPNSFIIIGSDQVWSKSLNNGHFDNTYLGDFPRHNDFQLIAYAASIGNSHLLESDWTLLKNKLERFRALSLREASFQSLLEKKVALKAALVCDPTLLLEASDWEKLANESTIQIKGDYIIVYEVVESEAVKEFANKLSQQLQCKIINISSCITYRKNKQNYIQDASPADFIKLIKFAKFVVTSSFHGTAFSIIFRKNFYTISLSEGIDSRAKSLLTTIGLQNRLIQSNAPIDLSDINYLKPEKLLNDFRNISKNFLFSSLNDK